MAKRKKPSAIKRKTKIPHGDQNNRLRRYALLIFFLGAAVYANTLFHNYTVDDAIVIYDNEFTTVGIAGIPGLLKYDTFRGFFKVEGKEALVSGGRYRPLTPVMYTVEVALFSPEKKDDQGQVVRDEAGNVVYDPDQGGQLNAVKFVGHLVNVLLYGLTGVVLFILLLTLFPTAKDAVKITDYSLFVALGATLLFVVHPVHTEVVANVKGRDEIISLLGSLAALYLSLKAFRENKPMLNLAAGVLYFLALLSKENAITFVAVVPMTYYFFTRANAGKVVAQTLPFFAVATLFVLIRGSVLDWNMGGGTPPRELMNNPFLKLVGNQYVDFTADEKFATIFYTLGKYIQLLLVPFPLSHDYYPRAVEIMRFSDWQVILSVLFYVAIGIYALIRLPKKDPVSYGILFYLGTLFLVSNIPFPIGTNMSERFLYMPSVGFSLMAAVLFYRLFKGKVIPGLVIVVLFAVLTFMRNFDWKDNYTLFTTDIQTVPNSAKLRNATGGVLIEYAIKPENEVRRTEVLTEATGHLNEAIRIHPGYKNPFLLLGNAYNYLEQYEASIQAYQQALKLDPGYEEALKNLGITYRDAGRFYGEKKGDLNRSIGYLVEAYKMRPDDYEAVRLLGVAYGVSGQGDKAVEFFARALEMKPDDPDALYNLGSAYYNVGQPETGEPYVQRALKLNPDLLKERQQRQ